MKLLKPAITLVVLLTLGTSLSAQLTIDNTVNAIDGVQNYLLGPGVIASNFSSYDLFIVITR